MTSPRLKTPFLIFVALFLAAQTSAFSVVRRTRSKFPTSLGVAEQKKPAWTELPRVRESKPDFSGVEINTGRLAMVGFIGLLGKEIVSGESFGDQIMDILSSASNVGLPL